MKTFFKISINGMGNAENIRIQSTKLIKIAKSVTAGYYKPKKLIVVGGYQIDIILALSYIVELGGTVTRPIKQRRYKLHKFVHEVHLIDCHGMLHNQRATLFDVSISIEEEDVQPCSCIISVDNK